jgi:hypothetical protein
LCFVSRQEFFEVLEFIISYFTLPKKPMTNIRKAELRDSMFSLIKEWQASTLDKSQKYQKIF